jgi:hypothetical protein
MGKDETIRGNERIFEGLSDLFEGALKDEEEHIDLT